MPIQFNNATFNGSLASVGAVAGGGTVLGVAVPLTYTGTSATGAVGLTSVTLDGTVGAPGSHVTASVASPAAAGTPAIDLTNVAATYLGYSTSATNNVEYYFQYTPTGVGTPVAFAVSGSTIGTQAAAVVNNAATSAPVDPNFPASAAGPVLLSSAVDGNSVTLTYDDVLGGGTPPTGAFTVAANGTALPVTATAVDGKTVTLTLGTAAAAGQTVTVAYTQPTAAGSPAAVQDLLGNDAASLTSPVTANNVTVANNGGTTTVSLPGGTVTTGSGGTTVTTPAGTVTVPVGVSTGDGSTTVTTPLGSVTTGSGGTTVTTPVGTVTVPVGVSTGSGGTTITTPLGPVTVPVGGTITIPGAGGGSTSISASSGGSSTVTSVGAGGAQTTETVPSGSTIAAGAGLAAGDVVSVDPYASFAGKGQFTIGGHVAAASGVTNVTISAVVDGGAPTVLGTATVAADGSYSFLDKVGAHLQGFITATETDSLGGAVAVQSPYSLQAGLHQGSFVAEQDLYTPAGDAEVALTHYKRDGSRKVDVENTGQTFQSDFFDTFNNGGAPDNTFVFNPGHGLDVVNLFRADGTDHDTLSFNGADFNNDIATVLQNTRFEKGGAVITDPTSGDTVKLTGVSKKELVANQSDFSFHA